MCSSDPPVCGNDLVQIRSFCCLLTSVCVCPSTATINLQHIGEQAEAMFGVGYEILHVQMVTCFYFDSITLNILFLVYLRAIFDFLCVCVCSKGNSILEVDDEGGRMFLRVLIHLTMHDYPPLVSGALQLLFRHFSQRQEVLHTFKQVHT